MPAPAHYVCSNAKNRAIQRGCQRRTAATRPIFMSLMVLKSRIRAWTTGMTGVLEIGSGDGGGPSDCGCPWFGIDCALPAGRAAIRIRGPVSLRWMPQQSSRGARPPDCDCAMMIGLHRASPEGPWPALLAESSATSKRGSYSPLWLVSDQLRDGTPRPPQALFPRNLRRAAIWWKIAGSTTRKATEAYMERSGPRGRDEREALLRSGRPPWPCGLKPAVRGPGWDAILRRHHIAWCRGLPHGKPSTISVSGPSSRATPYVAEVAVGARQSHEYLVERGHDVLAVDISPSRTKGLAPIVEFFRRRCAPSTGGRPW